MKLNALLTSLVAAAAIALSAAACAAPPAGLESPAPAPTVDVDGIVATVMAAIEAQPAATPDVAAIEAAILARVEERLAAQEEAQDAAQRQAVEAARQLANLEDTLKTVYRQANPAVVYIIVPPIGTGSGFVYAEDGTIVTNNHVVDGGRSFEIVFATGERRPAELIGTDVDSDLAVLKVADLPAGVDPLPLAEPDDLQVGQFVIAIGNPFGAQGSMSLGIVSGLDRSLPSGRIAARRSSYTLPGVIQTDAPINPGNSGGPLLNLNGAVVGINSAIASETGVNSGVGFAIPVAAVYRIVPGLIDQGEYRYGYMGAGFEPEIDLAEQELYRLPQTMGAYVISLVPDGPAEQAGLIAADPATGRGGDLIIAIDGVPIGDFADLNRYLVFNTAVGQTIEITLLRGDEEIMLPLTLEERP